MRSHGAWRHPPPVFRQSPFRARLPKSPFLVQFPPQKYPITSVCRPATGSISALGHSRRLDRAPITSGLPRWSQPVDATLYLEGEMECGLMVHKFHRGFTAAEKTELWDRWKRGESLKAIGRAFGKQSSSIYFLVAPHGGIRPAERRRSRLALTLAEREVISRGVTAHQSARSIARLLGRSPSTVSREMSRNGGCDRYRAALADENAWARARRPKCCKLANSPRLRRAVAGKLRLDWSPEQIAGWLKRTYPEDECNQVSHETIYRSLFVQTRGVLKKELLSHLRSKRSMRRSKPVDPNGDRRGHIKDIVSIRQRPAAVEDRAVPGHWEWRSVVRAEQQLHRDLGRASYALRDVGQGGR